jgi:hypothetical protein
VLLSYVADFLDEREREVVAGRIGLEAGEEPF